MNENPSHTGDERGIDAFRPNAGDDMPAPARRPWRRIVLPAAILLGAAWLLADAGWDAWEPRTVVVGSPVTVRTVEVAPDARTSGEADDVVVQAPGWVEAAPFTTYVSALTAGVVDQIRVLEGDQVEAGQVVATLVDDEARIAIRRAEAECRSREAALARAIALEEAAEIDLRELVANDRRVAIASAEEARL